MMRRDVWVALLLVLATLAAYGQVAGHGFVDLDDEEYVFENPHVRRGLTWEGVKWAFTTTRMANWHPLTWLSHMTDCELFGLDAGYHHFVSVLLHAANSLLLFLVLRSMTGSVMRSGMVAALFALHPLHVESVAWVSERKDVLSTLFFLLTLWAYAGYAARPGWGRYGLVAGLLVLGLLAKPMLVTTPFVLLLLDYWPLRRLGRTSLARLVGEKAPLFLIVAISSVVTFVVQQREGAMSLTYALPFGARAESALVSYVAYLGKMVWPTGLAVFYPYRHEVATAQWVGALLLLAGISVFVVWASRQSKGYWGVGWLWYLGMMVPVIGLVQVGMQSMADRYTYLPLIGVFLMGIWGAGELVASRRYLRMGVAGLAALVLTGCMVCTRVQVGYWEDGVKLFEHALKVTKGSALVHNNLGVSLGVKGELEKAMAHFQEAVRLDPHYEMAYYNLGLYMDRKGNIEEALQYYQKAIHLKPSYVDAHINLGVILGRQGNEAEAIAHYREALRFNPGHPTAHYNLGRSLAELGAGGEAILHFREAVQIDPGYAQAHSNLGLALAKQGSYEEALSELREAIRLKPDLAHPHFHLGVLLAGKGEIAEAIGHYREVVRIDPAFADTHFNLAALLTLRGEPEEAVAHYREAIRLKPDDTASLNDLAWILATHPDQKLRNGEEALELARKACGAWGSKDPNLLDTLAAAYAEASRFPEAIATLEEALSLTASVAPKELISELEKRLEGYRMGRPYREPEQGTKQE